MRQQHWILADLLRRKLFLKYEIKAIMLKTITKNNQITNARRYAALSIKSGIRRRAFVIQQTNRCFITGRPWYVLKFTRYSRFKFRTESNRGALPGFRRASW